MIKLYGFGPAFGLPDPSSFVMKVDAYLRMAELEFERCDGQQYLRKSPKGKLPFVDINGRVVADSQFIIAALDEQHNKPLDNWLTTEQLGYSHLAIKSLDEDLYWCLVYSRWVNDLGWSNTKGALFGGLPPVANSVIPWLVRRSITTTIKKQGLGLHSETEIVNIARYSLQALSDALGDKPYFMGDRPCNLDATAFGVLCQLILTDTPNILTEPAKSHVNLVSYCERVAKQYYPSEFSF